MQRKPTVKTALIRILIAAILLAVSAGFLFFRRIQPEVRDQLYDVTVVPPTCTDSGYSLFTSKENGATFADDIVPALGHSFGDWQIRQEGSSILPEIGLRVCTVCGAQEEQIHYPEMPIPLVALEGDLTGIGKTTEVSVNAEYISGDESFTAYALLKYQGHDSLRFDKKNYTLKLFRDEERQEKYKMTFSHWNPEHKYILKANYIDPSQCRNLICADVWADVTKSRDGLSAPFRNLSNYGAVDGFPVALYINREFEGLYTFNLHKDDDLFGMKDGRAQAILIANDASSPEAFFREKAAFHEDSPWEVEFCGTENSDWAKDKLNRLIAFVMESDDETFRKDLGKHLDVNSAIDYLLSIYTLGLTNHSGANLILVCYAEDHPFTASLYSMGTAFGLSEDGKALLQPDLFLPGTADSGTGNLLWDRLLKNFRPQIEQRYAELREEIFDPEALCRQVAEYTAAIPDYLTEADNSVYPHPNPDISHTEQITQYITRRIRLLDEIFLNGKRGTT